jgi:hypothetical protein
MRNEKKLSRTNSLIAFELREDCGCNEIENPRKRRKFSI